MAGSEVVERTEEGRGRRGRRRAVTILVVVALVLLGVWGTTARALSTSYGGASTPAEVGDRIHVGHAGLVDRDVTLLRWAADATDGLDVDLAVCTPRPGSSSIGGVREDELDDHCTSLEPVVRGTVLVAHSSEAMVPYLVTTITVTRPGLQIFCGLDLTYRSGVRFGHQTGVGSYQVVLNGEHDAADGICG